MEKWLYRPRIEGQLLFVGGDRRSPGLDGTQLPGHGLVNAEDMVAEPMHHVVENLPDLPLTENRQPAVNVLDFLAKPSVSLLVGRQCPLINTRCHHQLLFLTEMVAGVLTQPGEDRGSFLSGGIPGDNAVAEIIDKVDQTVVLFVDFRNTGDEVFVPGESCHTVFAHHQPLPLIPFIDLFYLRLIQ